MDFLRQVEESYQAVLVYIGSIQPVEVAISASVVLVATLALYLVLRLLRRVMAGVKTRVLDFGSRHIAPIRFQQQELFRPVDVARILGWIVQIIHFLIGIFFFYIYLSLILSLFVWTRNAAVFLATAFLDAVLLAATATVNFVPHLAIIAIVVVGSYFLVRMAGIIFAGIDSGRIRIKGFYPDWAKPTFAILRLLIYALALVVIFPYLPGSGSPAFQGVSIFIGVLLSLGSTSAVANVVAGVVITYMRAFKVGDRVQIANTVGDIVERSILVTKIQTPKNVITTIPNATVLANHIINYSSFARERGIILHTTVTIGYEVPWRQVHELLQAAAAATDNIESEPEPFVLQTSLDDFYVSYELNAYSREARQMPAIYSRLHENIQDRFNEAGVEIMSPHYGALRDGNAVTVPRENRPADYEPGGFRFEALSRILKRDEKT